MEFILLVKNQRCDDEVARNVRVNQIFLEYLLLKDLLSKKKTRFYYRSGYFFIQSKY